jgi:GT2 family glycosyltransferase
VQIAAMPDHAALAATVNRHLATDQAAMFAIIEAGDRLAPHALAEAARLMAAQPQTVLIYTDEDRVSGDGTRRDPSFKPDYSLDLSFAGDSFGQLALFGREAALQAGGLDEAAGRFMRYDLALRVAKGAVPANIRHIPKILFHRSRFNAVEQRLFPALRATPGANALADIVTRHLDTHYPGLALDSHWQGQSCWPVVTATLPTSAPRVSIIVPMRDRPELARRCLDGLMNGTDYPDIEIIIVDNGSVEPASLQFLQRIRHDPRIRVLPSAGPFNWSALNNQGAAVATGEVLLFLNNDIEIAEPGWLRLIAGHVMRRDIGVVGARLVFADGGLQHGGILLGPKAAAVHACTYSRNTGGYLGQVALGRDLSAVSGACLAMRAETLAQVGGFREQLVVTWGDVDLCLRVREAGLRVMWLAAALLIHHEMATRGGDTAPRAQIRFERERAIARRSHFAAMEHDPFLNPNLEATATSIVLATPPRPPADAQSSEHADG